MPIKFLSPDWATAVQEALNSDPGFRGAIGDAELGLQFHVTDTDEGDLAYYLRSAGGETQLALGELDGADVTLNQTYDTAAAIARGEMNAQAAFMTGKLKVSGNLAKLMMHQAAISQWQNATKDIDVDY